MFIDFNSPIMWIILGIIFIAIVALIITFFVMRAKTVVAVMNSITKAASDVLEANAKVKSKQAQNEHIRLRGHAVKCEYCDSEFTYKKASDIPANCPNCGGAMVYNTGIDTETIEEEYKESKAKIGMLLFAFSPIILGAIACICDWLFK